MFLLKIISLIVVWITLVIFAVRSVLKYRKSSKEEQKKDFSSMIRMVGVVPLSAIIFVGMILQDSGVSMDTLKPILFIVALVTIFIPGFLLMFYEVFSKEKRKDFNNPDKYGNKFIYKHRTKIVPLVLIIPVVMILFMLYKIAGVTF